MKFKNIKKIIYALPFAIIGFCILWTLYSNSYQESLKVMSSYMFSNNAQRILLNNQNDDETLQTIIKDKDIVLYCDLGEQSNLKGVYTGDNAKFRVPIMEGRFFTSYEIFNNNKVAVIGKGILDNTHEFNNRKYINIANVDYEVIGVMGISSISSSVDYTILLPFNNAKEILETNFIYTIDGNSSSIKNVLSQLEASEIKYQIVASKSVNLDKLYTPSYSITAVLYCFLIIIILIFILFVFFEANNKSKEINVYSMNGASLFQITVLLLKKQMMQNYVALCVGIIGAYILLTKENKLTTDIMPFIFTLLISLIIFVIGTVSAILSVQRKNLVKTYKTKRALKSSKYIFLLLSVTMAFTLIFTNILLASYSSQYTSHINLSEKIEKSYYTVTSGLSGEEFDYEISQPNFLQKAKKLHTEMSNSITYPYYDFIAQFITLADTELPYDFYTDIEEKAVSAVQVSDLFFTTYDLKLESGRLFNENEYIGDNITRIPVILGNAYNSIYSVGDTIKNCNYLFKDYELTVIGIMGKDSYFLRQGNLELLDYTIIMPSLSYVNDPAPQSNEWVHQIALYTQKLCGVFVLNNDNSFVNLASWLQSTITSTGMYKLNFINVPNTSAFFLESVSAEYINTIVILIISFIILLLVLFSQTAHYIFEIKKHYYEVLKICGASMLRIIMDICKRILLLSLGSNIVAIFITKSFIGLDYSLSLFGLSILTVIIASVLHISFVLKKDYIG